MSDVEKEFSNYLFAIKDLKTNKFGNPFVCNCNQEAIRVFNDLVLGSRDSLLIKHPEDFELFYLCGYDNEKGITSIDLPALLISAKEVVDSNEIKIRNKLLIQSQLNETPSILNDEVSSVA